MFILINTRGPASAAPSTDPAAGELAKPGQAHLHYQVDSGPVVATALSQLVAVTPDLLVSDIGMPQRDGYDLIREVRTGGSVIPAVALTAFARSEDRTRALLAGYDAHLTKPVEPGELLAMLSSLAQRRFRTR